MVMHGLFSYSFSLIFSLNYAIIEKRVSLLAFQNKKLILKQKHN
jgi:hypothetical protein